MWLELKQRLGLFPESKKQGFLVFLVAHAFYWAIAFLMIRGNELSLHEKLGVPLSGTGLIFVRAVSLTFFPGFYGGVNPFGCLVVLAVYCLVVFSVARADCKALFYSALFTWGLYCLTLLVVISAGMRS